MWPQPSKKLKHLNVEDENLSEEDLREIFTTSDYTPEERGRCVKTFWNNKDKLSFIIGYVSGIDEGWDKLTYRMTQLRKS
jgi:hypothetical protein